MQDLTWTKSIDVREHSVLLADMAWTFAGRSLRPGEVINSMLSELYAPGFVLSDCCKVFRKSAMVLLVSSQLSGGTQCMALECYLLCPVRRHVTCLVGRGLGVALWATSPVRYYPTYP